MARTADQRFFDRVAALEAGRRTEATPAQRSLTGAAGWGADPDLAGFRPLGQGGRREVPEITRERARTDSVAGYRSNPMTRSIIDTYIAFCVGDSGLTLNCGSDVVRPVAEAFWNDPANHLVGGQEVMLRSKLLMGEQLTEMMVGQWQGACRRNPIDPTRIKTVALRHGNPLWPSTVTVTNGLGDVPLEVIDITETGRRAGSVFFWPMFKALEWDVRGYPMLAPILDWLDSYDNVLSNLIDRTALSRYFVWDVTLDGADPAQVDEWVNKRKGLHAPGSGTVVVHNEKEKWTSQSAQAGAYEDTTTSKSVLTNVAAGAGLSKVWLAEPEDANRATSLTMAEPVRRRIGSVQNEHLNHMTEMVRFAVDQAVNAGILEPTVKLSGPGGVEMDVAAADTVHITGPQVAAADAQVTAEVLKNLSQSLTELESAGILSRDAARVAAQKAWEDYMGTPFRPELAADDADTDEIATAVEDAGGRLPLVAV